MTAAKSHTTRRGFCPNGSHAQMSLTVVGCTGSTVAGHGLVGPKLPLHQEAGGIWGSLRLMDAFSGSCGPLQHTVIYQKRRSRRGPFPEAITRRSRVVDEFTR